MQIGSADAHLLGKLLDAVNDEWMKDFGFTIAERSRAEWLFEDLDEALSARVGDDWNEMEVG